jgi:hypothetical protein
MRTVKARLGCSMRTIRGAAEEDGAMNGIRRAIGVGVLITLGVLSTGWALERVSGSATVQPGAAVTDSTTVTNVAPVTRPSSDGAVGLQPVPTDSGWEYDRSDLILSQG